jgi:hypothetical protein
MWLSTKAPQSTTTKGKGPPEDRHVTSTERAACERESQRSLSKASSDTYSKMKPPSTAQKPNHPRMTPTDSVTTWASEMRTTLSPPMCPHHHSPTPPTSHNITQSTNHTTSKQKSPNTSKRSTPIRTTPNRTRPHSYSLVYQSGSTPPKSEQRSLSLAQSTAPVTRRKAYHPPLNSVYLSNLPGDVLT